MRRSAISSAAREEESEINLTPMLDVVFIMLIFFIVTANFIKEPGLEVNRPDSDTSEIQENAAILIAVGGNDEIYMDGRRIDVRQVKANVLKLLLIILKEQSSSKLTKLLVQTQLFKLWTVLEMQESMTFH
ncbi:MAG: hypothetical protein CM15mP31_0930 [Gammaproteobacteria bacterium]|nr:MAG: hypothetical protein CM15mP31_0930 [Gammaproteobacteria bacterium]